MASTHKALRSGTANKRPTTSIADGQIALNTNTTSPGLFFKDSTGATIIKVGPVHVGTTAPNATPASGGSSGNSSGEVWLDISLTPNGVKIWDGSAWVNATPSGSTTVQGLLELATNAETQTGSDTARAVTPAGLQSKISDSTSTTSSTTIASSTAVKAAYDLAAAAVPLSGGIVTGNLEIGSSGSLSFEGSTTDGFETTIAVVNPTADRTITLPNITGTVVTTGDTGTVTSTMLGSNLAVAKLQAGTARQLLQTNSAGTGVEWTSNVALGSATATTPAPADDSTAVATTAFVKDQAYLSSSNAALTGVPTAPTAAVGTNTTQIATTAFVGAEIANDAPTKTGTGASGTWGISISGTAAAATTSTNLSVAAGTATTNYVLFAQGATGSQAIKTDTGLTYNASTNVLGANISGTSAAASSATILSTGRTISLTGDVTGTSAAFNGAANVSIAAAIGAGVVGTTELANSGVTAAKLNGAQSGSAPIYGARAWANVNGISPGSIRGDGNFTSLTRLGNGHYRLAFTTAMASASYAAVTGGSQGAADNDNTFFASNLTTTTFSLISNNQAGLSYEDYVYGFVAVFQ